MKRDLEELLREAPLRAPSAQLARRIADEFELADAEGTRWLRVPIPLWACAAAALVCGAVGYLARGAPPPPQVVYILPAQGELRRVLAGDATRPEDFLRGLQVRAVARGGKGL